MGDEEIRLKLIRLINNQLSSLLLELYNYLISKIDQSHKFNEEDALAKGNKAMSEDVRRESSAFDGMRVHSIQMIY